MDLIKLLNIKTKTILIHEQQIENKISNMAFTIALKNQKPKNKSKEGCM